MKRRADEQRWGRRVLHLPTRGTLLFATDLHGNLADYERLKALYFELESQGEEPFLLLCGDLVHGPSPDLNEPGQWPDYLGDGYVDQSADLVLDYLAFSANAQTSCLLGNHEHAHIGGPQLGKFYSDEAAVLNAALGADQAKVLSFFETFPLIALSSCGAAFTHAAPAATEPTLEAFEELTYRGYEHININEMSSHDTLGALLWARHARVDQARAFLTVCGREPQGPSWVAYGHDVVREGYEKVGREQICLSTSYGLYDRNKVLLRLRLDTHYPSVDVLVEGREIVPLYP